MIFRIRTAVQVLRSGSWLSDFRLVAYPRAVLIICVALSLWFLATAFAGHRDSWWAIGPDFLPTWVASRIAVSQPQLSPYDRDALLGFEGRIFSDIGGRIFPFPYPPTYLPLILPLGFISLHLALLCWTLLGLGVYGAALRRLAPSGSFFAILGFPGLWASIFIGQNGPLMAGCFGLALINLDKRPWLAGALFGLLACKPQLVLIVPILLAVTGRWRQIAGAAASVVALAAISTLLFGPGIWPAWLAELRIETSPESMQNNAVWISKMQSIFAQSWNLGASIDLASAIQSVVAVCAAIYVCWVWRSGADQTTRQSALIVGALASTPYLFDYDLAILGIPIALLASQGVRSGFFAWEKTILAAAWFLPLFARPLSMSFGVVLTPLVFLSLLAIIHRRAFGFPAPPLRAATAGG